MRVAVYTVCKDEAKNVEEWYQSASQADCIAVADTGSRDGTLELLQAKGKLIKLSQIAVNPWRFDDARNAALALVPTDIDVCVSLDLDERLERGWYDVLERDWKVGVHTSASYTYVFNHNPDGSPAYTYMHDRMHCRHGWRWRYPDHEGLYPDRMTAICKAYIPDFRIHQYQDRGKDRSGVLARLEMGVREFPNDARMIHYYGRELYYAGRYKEAKAFLERYVALGSGFPVEAAQNARILADCWDKLA